MPSFAISQFIILLEPLWVPAEFLLLSTGPLLYGPRTPVLKTRGPRFINLPYKKQKYDVTLFRATSYFSLFDNPLFYKDTESVTLDEMLPFPYISSPPEMLSIDDDRLEISRHLIHQQKKTHLTVSNRGMLYDLLENTTAYSISSNNRNAYSKKPAYEKIRAIPLKDSGFEFEIGWICRENFILSPICAEFVNKIIATLTGGDSNTEKSVLPQGLSH